MNPQISATIEVRSARKSDKKFKTFGSQILSIEHSTLKLYTIMQGLYGKTLFFPEEPEDDLEFKSQQTKIYYPVNEFTYLPPIPHQVYRLTTTIM